MLAYVFWHSPKRSADIGAYEAELRRFHRALASEPSRGFLSSLTYRIDAVPWLRVAGAAYEDWYLLEDSAALDVLNAAAVTGARAQAHGLLAESAEMGAGGLYRLHGGAPSNGDGFAHWFSKPEGMTYDEINRSVAEALAQGCAVWRRQMVLGPALEFCLTDDERRSISSVWPVIVARRAI